MARYPSAAWKPLPQNSTQLRIKPVGIVLHTAVSNSASLYPYFSSAGAAGVESHFYVRQDGSIEQMMDTEVRADCQLDGNSWLSGGTRYGFISVETWDGAGTSAWPDWRTNGNGAPPWNAAQLAALEKLIAWAAKLHGFPIEKATGPQGTGVGWHNLFTTPSSSSAPSWNHTHACPGTARIAQIPALINAAKDAGQAVSAVPPPTTPKELPLLPGTLARLVQVPGDAAIYVIGLDGRAYHVPNAVALSQGRRAGYYSNEGRPNAISRSDLNKILVK